MSDYIKVLRNKTQISIPELQLALGLSYTEVRQQMKTLSEHGVISRAPDGVYYAVNARSISKREVDESECKMYAEMMEEWDFSLLGRMTEAEYGRADCYPTEDRFNEMLERLEQLGLVHFFDGKYYISVTQEAIRDIKEAYYLSGSRLAIIYFIAYPILMNAIEMEIDPMEIISLPFLSDICKEYVVKGYSEYLCSGEKPVKKKRRVNAFGDTLMFSMTGSFFLLSKNYETKEEFDNEARRNADVISRSPLCTDLIKETAVKAAQKIIDGYTLEEIYGAKKELNGIFGRQRR